MPAKWKRPSPAVRDRIYQFHRILDGFDPAEEGAVVRLNEAMFDFFRRNGVIGIEALRVVRGGCDRPPESVLTAAEWDEAEAVAVRAAAPRLPPGTPGVVLRRHARAKEDPVFAAS